jgi:transcriptional regulator with XRE-family HTH domain
MKKQKPERAILSENVEALRRAHGISQEKLGELAGLHRTYISQVERQKVNITLDSLERLAAVLGVRVTHLFVEGLMLKPNDKP